MTVNIVNPLHIGYVGSIRPSGDEAGDAWFTPPDTIADIRAIIGDIDLDPFSSEQANLIVGANRFFSLDNNAFLQKNWKAKTIFMNPPYSRGLCAKAIARLLTEFRLKSFRSAIVLVNNMTDTVWFQSLAQAAQRRCDFRGRIAFVTGDNKRVSGNTRGQTLFLLSKANKNALSKFDCIMADKGLVYKQPIRSVEND